MAAGTELDEQAFEKRLEQLKGKAQSRQLVRKHAPFWCIQSVVSKT